MELTRQETKKSLLIFIGIAFSLSILLSLFISGTGGHKSKFMLYAFSAFLIPAIAVLVMKFRFKEPVHSIGFNKFSFKWLIIALFLIPIIVHLVCLPILSFQNGFSLPWQSWLTPDADGLFHSPEKMGGEAITRIQLISKIAINALVGLIAVSFLAFFEEIGWRAWMLPRLIKKYNVKKGVFIGAIIWALWHIPFVLSEIHYIEGFSKISLLLLNPLGHLGAGIVISWLWLKSKSIWIICLAHGALNNWGQFAFKYMRDDVDATLLLIGFNGSLLILGLIILNGIKNEKI